MRCHPRFRCRRLAACASCSKPAGWSQQHPLPAPAGRRRRRRWGRRSAGSAPVAQAWWMGRQSVGQVGRRRSTCLVLPAPLAPPLQARQQQPSCSGQHAANTSIHNLYVIHNSHSPAAITGRQLPALLRRAGQGGSTPEAEAPQPWPAGSHTSAPTAFATLSERCRGTAWGMALAAAAAPPPLLPASADPLPCLLQARVRGRHGWRAAATHLAILLS